MCPECNALLLQNIPSPVRSTYVISSTWYSISPDNTNVNSKIEIEFNEDIIENVKANGDKALKEYALKFDKAELENIKSRIHSSFVVDKLDFLHAGGRCARSRR